MDSMAAFSAAPRQQKKQPVLPLHKRGRLFCIPTY
jgi:hypothetical protein